MEARWNAIAEVLGLKDPKVTSTCRETICYAISSKTAKNQVRSSWLREATFRSFDGHQLRTTYRRQTNDETLGLPEFPRAEMGTTLPRIRRIERCD